MKSAGSFLSRFEKLTPPNDALRRAVAKAASTILGKTVTKEQVRIQNRVAFIETTSVAKNKLRLERQELFDLMCESLPKARDLVRDIR